MKITLNEMVKVSISDRLLGVNSPVICVLSINDDYVYFGIVKDFERVHAYLVGRFHFSAMMRNSSLEYIILKKGCELGCELGNSMFDTVTTKEDVNDLLTKDRDEKRNT